MEIAKDKAQEKGGREKGGRAQETVAELMAHGFRQVAARTAVSTLNQRVDLGPRLKKTLLES